MSLPHLRTLFLSLAVAAAAAALPGCAVIAVAGTAASVAATGVGLAVDAGVGAVKLTGKAVGATVDAVTPDAE